MRYWIIVTNNPVRWVDPWGLESEKFELKWKKYKGLPVIYSDDVQGALYKKGKIYVGDDFTTKRMKVKETLLYHEYIHSKQSLYMRKFQKVTADIEAYSKQLVLNLKFEKEAYEIQACSKEHSKKWQEATNDIEALRYNREDLIMLYFNLPYRKKLLMSCGLAVK